MKNKFLITLAVCTVALYSCQKEGSQTSSAAIPQDVLNQLTAKGFSTDGVMAVPGGYLVEGDLFFSAESLSKTQVGPDIIIAKEEQYRTTNLITHLPRTITVSNAYPSLQTLFNAATDSAIARYNALNLRLKFNRVASGGDINIVGADLGTTFLGTILGQSSGFPDANGNPASSITLNSHKGTFTNNTNVQWLATIIAHEMGHTIGMRHTDYANRNYSCGLSFPKNEGQAGVGAIYIPGTSVGPKDKGSWMLACTDGTNRPFNANDAIALTYLYH